MTAKAPRKLRVCRQCGQRVAVVDGRWSMHVDPMVVPKGSSCDRAGEPYIPNQRPLNRGLEQW